MLHFLCLAHGINLAVNDVIQVKKTKEKDLLDQADILDQDDSLDDDSDDETGNITGLQFENDPSEFEVQNIVDDIQVLILKVRKICKKFRKSPVKNDEHLQSILKKDFGHELNLILDCPTRWNSLHTMLERFLKIQKQVKYALQHMEYEYDLDDNDIAKIEDLVRALEPLKDASLALCRRDATLLDAEITIEMTIEALDELNTTISQELKESFIKRVVQRRIPKVIHLISYLHDPKYLRKTKDQFGNKIDKAQITSLATEMLKRLFNIEDSNVETEVSTGACSSGDGSISRSSKDSGTDSGKLSFKEKLALKIEQNKAKSNMTPTKVQIETSVVKKEMQLFEDPKNNGVRPANLQLLYDVLLTILPTSVESERSFSAAGLFVTKIRSRLGDSTLNVLVFLRDYFKRHNKD